MNNSCEFCRFRFTRKNLFEVFKIVKTTFYSEYKFDVHVTYRFPIA